MKGVGSNNCFIQFRAGKMLLTDGKVVADTRRGTLSFSKESNGVVKMTWVSGSHAEHYDLPLGQVKFSRVDTCTTGRVLLFDFGKAQPPLFFWMQEKSTDNDNTYFSAVENSLVQNPSAIGSLHTHTSPLTDQARARLEGYFASALNNVRGGREQDVDLVSIVGSAKVVDALRADPDYFMCRLHPFLPEGTDSTSGIVEHVINPQVSAAAASLGLVLQTPDGFRELCAAFHVDGKKTGVVGFISGLLKQVKK
ncbi:hypothetical protein, conserved [Trypanosoma brucei brucei TREU927]|uniref:Pru domain-containing protein n=1 Tax=Trypanosoma brucei brucei (strain 927/4 GUTat10.1) TaxID=185431 RepID=Q38D00_TRYB2|nr:hypothetical protein, conserved [Trypanosoma brucei brucei TREU927]EAN77320.1 hypothetical protein, conserved [Trypanosoma brucei brucei TREU927]